MHLTLFDTRAHLDCVSYEAIYLLYNMLRILGLDFVPNVVNCTSPKNVNFMLVKCSKYIFQTHAQSCKMAQPVYRAEIRLKVRDLLIYS